MYCAFLHPSVHLIQHQHFCPGSLIFPRPVISSPPCTPASSFPPFHTHQSFLLSSPSPPGSLLCPAVSWSHELSHSSHSAHHCASQPCPSSCTSHSFSWAVLSWHPSPQFLPSPPDEHLLSIYTSSRSTSVPTLCSHT